MVKSLKFFRSYKNGLNPFGRCIICWGNLNLTKIIGGGGGGARGHPAPSQPFILQNCVIAFSSNFNCEILQIKTKIRKISHPHDQHPFVLTLLVSPPLVSRRSYPILGPEIQSLMRNDKITRGPAVV